MGRTSSPARDRAKELDDLALFLSERGLCLDPGPLYQAAETCRNKPEGTWGYDLSRLVFRIPDAGKSVPRSIHSPTATLSVSLAGVSRDDVLDDPLERLAIDIVVEAKSISETGDGKYLASWHLDRDLWKQTDQPQEFLHPLYHLQHGGHRVWNAAKEGTSFGAALILEAPRVAHPPMDAILAIDYLLTNFWKQDALLFRKEGLYSRLLTSAQARLWRPYAYHLALYWMDVMDRQLWPDRRLWPQVG